MKIKITKMVCNLILNMISKHSNYCFYAVHVYIHLFVNFFFFFILDFDENLLKNEDSIKFEGDRLSEEITVDVDVDPHFNDDDSSKWKRRPESCKLCGKWFNKVCFSFYD